MADKIRVDFSDVDEGGAYAVPGKYTARVESTEVKAGDKAPYIEWTLHILDGASAGKNIIHRTSLAPAALFGLKDTLVAMGVNVPKAAVSLDPDKFIGKTLGIEVAMRPYEGKEYANVVKVFSPTASTVKTDVPAYSGEVPFSTKAPSPVDEVSIDLE